MVTPASSQSLLQGPGLERYDRDGQLPHWAELWPASVGMARLLMKGPALTGKRVMDLGCGLGLSGIAAGRRGARVLFADREEEALRFALFNSRQNGVHDAQSLEFDWHRSTAPSGFDLICLADVAYEEESCEPLLRHLEGCLLPGGEALVGDPYREITTSFLEKASEQFRVQRIETDTFFEGSRTPLRLAWIRHP